MGFSADVFDCLYICSLGGVSGRLPGGLTDRISERSSTAWQTRAYIQVYIRLPPWFHIRRSANDDSVQADEGHEIKAA